MTFNEGIEGFVKIVGVLSPFVMAWLAIKQTKANKATGEIKESQEVMKKNQDEMNIKVDGHLGKLMALVDQGHIDKGQLQEKEHSEKTIADLNEKLVDATRQIPTGTNKPIIAEVKVVNEKPIEVKNIPPDPLTFSKPAAPNDDSLK